MVGSPSLSPTFSGARGDIGFHLRPVGEGLGSDAKAIGHALGQVPDLQPQGTVAFHVHRHDLTDAWSGARAEHGSGGGPRTYHMLGNGAPRPSKSEQLGDLRALCSTMDRPSEPVPRGYCSEASAKTLIRTGGAHLATPKTLGSELHPLHLPLTCSPSSWLPPLHVAHTWHLSQLCSLLTFGVPLPNLFLTD